METAKQSDTESDDENEKEKLAGPAKKRSGPQECLLLFNHQLVK